MSKDSPLPPRLPWTPLEELMDGIREVTNDHNWRWAANMPCKYISIRIDMRDKHALLLDRDGEPITIEQLKRQAFKLN